MHIETKGRIGIAAAIPLALLLFGFTLQEVEQAQKLTLQKQLENEFVAPCCWREAVAMHRSGASIEVREKINVFLDEGKTPEEIKASLVDEYGERILIKPTTEGFNLLAWIGPFIIIGLGFVVVGGWLYRFRPASDSAEIPDPDEDEAFIR